MTGRFNQNFNSQVLTWWGCTYSVWEFRFSLCDR